MASDTPRNYTRIVVALVVATLVIGAGVLASSYFGSATTTPQNASTAAPTNPSCTPTADLAAPRNFAFNIAVNYTGHWNATVTSYSGTIGAAGSTSALTEAFVDCYTGNGVGLIYLSDWNEGGQATLHVLAEKTDPGAGNLSISIRFGSSNSLTEKNSTSLPNGSSTITATMLGLEAVVQSATTASVTVGTQLYEVTFQQIGACSPAVYTAPWAVTLGGETIAQPSNTTLPIPGGSYIAGTQFQGLSAIVFSVPNGLYQYSISPTGPFDRTAGSVMVNGTNVTVPVEGPVVSCVTTTH